MKNLIRLSIFLAGLTAMASQIIYMRELLVVFYGNELSISFILAGWLIAGAIGSAILGRFSDRLKNKIMALAVCQIILSLMLPSGIVAARIIKPILNINAGQILPLFPTIALSFLILAPICIVLGFIFSLGCAIQSKYGDGGSSAVGNVYILESVGSLVGGAVTSVILVRYFDAVNIAAFFSLLNLAAAFFLNLVVSGTKGKKVFAPAKFMALLAVLFFLSPAFIHIIDGWSIKKQWQGYDLLASKDSIYGNIAVVKRGEERSFFGNGMHLYTVPDRSSAEEAVHLVLLEHPDPKNVLLIGGGAGGLVGEALKEGIAKIDYVELDPLTISMARDHLPTAYYNTLKDKRVSIKNIDGRSFVKRAKEKYDCVIVHLGDPYTASVNRYYTLEFFKEVKNVLKKDGIFSVSLSSSENYINNALGEFLASIYHTLKSVFKNVIAIPGEKAVFLASEDGALTYDYKILENRTRKRALDTRYVREYYLFSKLSPDKINYLENVLKREKNVRINKDLEPAAYYYGLIFWTTLFRESKFSDLLRVMNERVIWQALGVIVMLLALSLLFFKRSFKKTALTAMAAGGFSTMAFQILMLIAFQILHGYLFYELGIILTAFMAGLAIGAIFALKIAENDRGFSYPPGGARTFLIAVQADLLIYSLILPVFFIKFGSVILFPVMSIVAGFIGGAQFPLVNKVLLTNKGPGRVGGLTYGVDLIGAFFGALFTGAFLIPILGILKTCMVAAVINLAVLILLVLNVSIEE